MSPTDTGPPASAAWATPPASARERRNDDRLRAELVAAMEALRYDR